MSGQHTQINNIILVLLTGPPRLPVPPGGRAAANQSACGILSRDQRKPMNKAGRVLIKHWNILPGKFYMVVMFCVSAKGVVA